MANERFWIALCGAEQRSFWREKGEHCLRAFRPELRSPRRKRVAQGTPQSGAPNRARVFFGYSSFGETKESNPRVRRGTQRLINPSPPEAGDDHSMEYFYVSL